MTNELKALLIGIAQDEAYRAEAQADGDLDDAFNVLMIIIEKRVTLSANDTADIADAFWDTVDEARAHRVHLKTGC